MYLNDSKKNSELKLYFQHKTTPLNLIDVSREIDIATFYIDEDLINAMKLEPISYRLADWPPPEPEVGNGAIFAGYPGADQAFDPDGAMVIRQMASRLLLTRASGRNVVARVYAQFLRTIDGKIIDDSSAAEFMANVGGYSGAPLLIENKSLHPLLHVGGVISEGGSILDTDQGRITDIVAEPARRIRPDGRLNHSVI